MKLIRERWVMRENGVCEHPSSRFIAFLRIAYRARRGSWQSSSTLCEREKSIFIWKGWEAVDSHCSPRIKGFYLSCWSPICLSTCSTREPASLPEVYASFSPRSERRKYFLRLFPSRIPHPPFLDVVVCSLLWVFASTQPAEKRKELFHFPFAQA